MDVQELTGLLPAPGPSARSYLVGRFTVVELLGEIDLVSAEAAQVHTDAATSSPGARVIIDLRPATFIDCSALRLLCRTRRRALDRGGSVDLVCTRPWHLCILRTAGLDGYFPGRATVSDVACRGC
ncbi:anti-sigma factor antagonist [Streptomyces sp. NBC_00344]|uniref:anti-sigma factor antagonist n=1 Tax=Streptomyces sp. NBC_00344 TaxID=2975720 RepID=UPI002E236308|nr:anti-sigma factor antagonist [Streptomyces sp. NBC_00344]